MWDFTEKEIERFLTRLRGAQKRPVLRIDGESYVVLCVQGRLCLPETSQPNPQRPLFPQLKDLKPFLPLVAGQVKIPDIITYKKPKSPGNGLVVFELKVQKATVDDAAQLRQYVNTLKHLVRHDIGAINKKLGVTRAYKVSGVLLAPSIPVDVWLAANSVDAASEEEVQLVAYDLVSSRRSRRIDDISYKDFTAYYRDEFRKRGRKYKADRARRKPRQPKLGVGG